MATRTYTNVDFTNYLAGFTANTYVDSPAVASPFGQFNVTISANQTIPFPGTVANQTVDSYNNFAYELSGELDFDAFPSIPAGAQISRVEVRADVEYSAAGGATSTSFGFGGNPRATGSASVAFRFWRNFSIMSDLTTEDSDQDINSAVGTTTAAITISGFDHYTKVQIFDYESSPISKGDLITNFTNWLVQIFGVGSGTADRTTSPNDGLQNPTAANDNLGLTISGVQITVTYTDGPITMTLSPSGGNVEIGQTITATGPNAADLEYAAIIGDKVVPIKPKKINDDEVLLEIPYPSYGPCFDCFGDCPNCDACVDACVEDLTGEDCQACMQECLDCLTVCLEDLAAAEECQQTAGTDGDDPTEVVIIAGTQFSGSVTLGSFTILVANGSGIYRFVLGKAEDTIYAAARDGTTYDVKIPNPGGKTAFFRS